MHYTVCSQCQLNINGKEFCCMYIYTKSCYSVHTYVCMYYDENDDDDDPPRCFLLCNNITKRRVVHPYEKALRRRPPPSPNTYLSRAHLIYRHKSKTS